MRDAHIKGEQAADSAMLKKTKKKKYDGIMRCVIMSDSWSDFIKVVIAERLHSTYKPPTPSTPRRRNLLIVAFGEKRAHFG